MQNDRLLSPLRQSVRQFNRSAIEFHTGQLLKKTNDPAASPRLKIEIYLEVVKAFRILDRPVEAARYADVAVANVPADSLDVLAALKRIRALLHLDGGEPDAALNLIEGCDGMEMILEGGRSLITRSDDDVSVETWLVSAEIAFTQRDLQAAQKYFDNAVNRLAAEEKTLRHKRINPMERKSREQYYHDLGRMLSLFGLTLAYLQRDEHARPGLVQLCRQVEEENALAAEARKLPNVPLHSKLLCLLGTWSPQMSAPPPGLSGSEARRWAAFAAADTAESVIRRQPVLQPPSDVAPSMMEREDSVSDLMVVSRSSSEYSGQAEKVLDVTMTAIERLGRLFQQFERILPNIQNGNEGEKNNYSKRGFGGHLQDTDLGNFMHNFDGLRFTGYLHLKWDKDFYKKLIFRGVLPEIALVGEAYLYVIEGAVTDVVFAGQTGTPTIARAQENFILLVRMCFTLGVEGMLPEIVGSAVPDAAVMERPRHIKVQYDDLLYIISDIESELAGVTVSEGQPAAAGRNNEVPEPDKSPVPVSHSVSPPRPPDGDDENLFDLADVMPKKPAEFDPTASRDDDGFWNF